jgi:transposase
MAKAKRVHTGVEYPVQYKLAAVQERLRGTREEDVAKAFGISKPTVAKWMKAFRERGPEGLKSGRAAANRERKKPSAVKRDKVVALKKQNEQWGSRRIRDVLARFEALGVSEQVVRRILHDEGLIETPSPKVEREHPPRRFERATPNRLWQSDLRSAGARRRKSGTNVEPSTSTAPRFVTRSRASRRRS